MTSYGAYEAGLPCKNPSCKSHGRPHPNCKCYGDMAEGGDASFCSQDRKHNPDCQYFAEGDQVQPDEPDQDSVIPDPMPAPDEPDQDSVIPDQPSEPDQDSVIPDEPTNPYDSTGQQLATVAEGLAQGFAGPVATAAEIGLSKLGVPGTSASDQRARAAAHPIEHGLAEAAGTIGGFMTGTGEAGLAMKAGEAAADMMKLGKYGSAFVKNGLPNLLIQGGDEVTKWILGQGDPEHAAASSLAYTGLAGLIGGSLGAAGVAAGDVASKAATELAESKFGERAQWFLNGLGSAIKNPDPAARAIANQGMENLPTSALKGFKAGQETYKWASRATYFGNPLGEAAYEAKKGYDQDGVSGAMTGAIEGLASGLWRDAKIKGLALGYNKIAAPTIMRVINSGTATGIFDAFDHAVGMFKGNHMADKLIGAIFDKAVPSAGQQVVNSWGADRDRDAIDRWITNGGSTGDTQQQIYKDNEQQVPNFAEGGEVKPNAPILDKPNGVGIHFPEQNILLSAAKGRMSNYLSSLKPQTNEPKLAFDDEPDMREKKKSYDKALGIAAKPLGILNEIKQGTIEGDDVKHFTSLYPELTSLLQKKMTDRITQDQIDGKKPHHRMRQGLSLFMGAPLSSELTPEGIQAAQAVFASAAPAQQQAAPQKSKKGTQSLSKSDQAFLTQDQALEKRSQRQS